MEKDRIVSVDITTHTPKHPRLDHDIYVTAYTDIGEIYANQYLAKNGMDKIIRKYLIDNGFRIEHFWKTDKARCETWKRK